MSGIFAFNGQVYNETFASSVTWTVTHNLNTTTPCVNCYTDPGGGFEQTIPLSVTVTNANEIDVTWSVATAGRVVVA